MRIVSITAGAAGMFCGSCMRDNTLAAALIALGHDALLVPTYTPITVDEPDRSGRRVFLGGVNVFLQQKSWLFRHTPRFVDSLFNGRGFLRWVGRFAGKTDYSKLGDLTISMLRGRHGKQRKEVAKLVDWLRGEIRPDAILMTNALLSGVVPALRDALGVPVWTTLQGDDIFLDELPAGDRAKCVGLIRTNDRHTTGYIATSHDYADHMAAYLGLDRAKISVVLPGISLKGHAGPQPRPADRPPTLGYFSRIAPEKGFHNVVDAFIRLRQTPGAPAVKFRYAGWLGEKSLHYLREQERRLSDSGLSADAEHVRCPDLPSKVRFLQSIDVLSVPTVYREPKGLSILEAWANGVPVVQPAHGSFPELIGVTGGGLLVEPNDNRQLAEALLELLRDPARCAELGRKGYDGVTARLTARHMAENTLQVLNGTGSVSDDPSGLVAPASKPRV